MRDAHSECPRGLAAIRLWHGTQYLKSLTPCLPTLSGVVRRVNPRGEDKARTAERNTHRTTAIRLRLYSTFHNFYSCNAIGNACTLPVSLTRNSVLSRRSHAPERLSSSLAYTWGH